MKLFKKREKKIVESITQEMLDEQIKKLEEMNPNDDLEVYKIQQEYVLKLIDKRNKSIDQQMEDNDKKIKRLIDIMGIGLPVLAWTLWMNKGLKFEQTGTFSSGIVKQTMNKLRFWH